MWPAQFQSDEWFRSGTYTERTVTGVVEATRKVSASRNYIDIDGTTYQTGKDSSAGYAVSPHDWEGREVTLCLDDKGLIVGVAYVYPDAVRRGVASAPRSMRG